MAKPRRKTQVRVGKRSLDEELLQSVRYLLFFTVEQLALNFRQIWHNYLPIQLLRFWFILGLSPLLLKI